MVLRVSVPRYYRRWHALSHRHSYEASPLSESTGIHDQSILVKLIVLLGRERKEWVRYVCFLLILIH